MRVIRIGAGEDERRWDDYVGARTATVADLPGWRRVLEEAYGLRTWTLAAVEGDRLVGGLGLCESRHHVFGRTLTTAPFFCNAGGLYFDDAAARDALLAEAKAVADRLGSDSLLVRTMEPRLEGFLLDGRYRTAVIDLSGGAEAVWNRVLRAKTRNQVRKGMNEGFSVETGPGQLGAFFDVFHEHMRDLGSPAHSRRFYESIARNLGDRSEFYVVRDGRDLVAGALLFWVNGTAMNLHTVALHEYNPRCPNYLLYWKMIEASCARGCTRFDLGRSEADGPNLAFKEHWGARPLPLCYNYYLPKGGDLPYVDPRNPRYRLPIEIWRRLPVAFTKRLGPSLVAGLP
ncbi:MAG TPA: FemAB family XrtA/PEP-CTERM system-associated protein [Elusimicrobiota bacterium]|nr:FemAB family XrtA/PEP-CTERM system-associated protein [Elusimicrobiota bacterium]